MSPSRTNRFVLTAALAVLVIGGAAVLLALAGRAGTPAQPASTSVSAGAAQFEGTPFNGVTEIIPPRPVADFVLTNQEGQPIRLSDFRGKWTLLFFGFTHCPDVCPLTLLEYKQIKRALGADADSAAFVFISVDGERDTPAALKDYIARFDPAIVGLTGDEATLRQIGTDYNLVFNKRASPTGKADDYLIDHTSNMFVLNPQGELTAVYTFGTEVEIVSADLQKRIG